MMPKIVSINETWASGCLQGYINISYDRLVEAFGEPINNNGYKVDPEWVIEFADGKVGTLYNYKDGKNYQGVNGLATEDITEWHIGGTSSDVVRYITNHLFSNWPPAFEDIRQEAEY